MLPEAVLWSWGNENLSNFTISSVQQTSMEHLLHNRNFSKSTLKHKNSNIEPMLERGSLYNMCVLVAQSCLSL